MNQLSESDRRFRENFELGRITPAQFDHRAHVRLAYIFLAEQDADTATASMKNALLQFLAHHRVDAAKYHETMTRAWIMAVQHFMHRGGASASADEFIDDNPRLLDAKIMMTHYSAGLLFSPEARARFVKPDLQEIPGT
jgi:hypothetical protein